MKATYTFLFFFFISHLIAQVNLTSPLADGQIIKVPVSESGVYQIDYNYLKNAGLNIDAANPKNISIWGNGGGMMNGLITADYDLAENSLHESAIFISGEDDNSFDSGDYILFYGEGVSKVALRGDRLSKELNRFDTKNYYFIKVGDAPGLRISNQASANNPTYTSTGISDVIRYEKDEKNLLKEWTQTQGSGQHWFGDQFKNTRSRAYDKEFNFPNRIEAAGIQMEVRMAARSISGSTNFEMVVGTESKNSSTINAVGGGSTTSYCLITQPVEDFFPQGDNVEVEINYPPRSFESEAWLDFIEINATRESQMVGNQMFVRDLASMQEVVTAFEVGGLDSNFEVWDVTDPAVVAKQEGSLNGSTFNFNATTIDQLKQFIVFNKNSGFLTPGEATSVENQNLHGIDNVDLAIIYHPNFAEAAQKLATHREDYNGYEIAMVTIDEVFNEFSSGSLDPVGIRNFSKMLYDRNPDKFKFLILFGDGSYDFRNINNEGGNFVPVYETINSTHPIESYPADDYFTLLTDGEGATLSGKLDVAVGRFPVSTLEEANAVVDKIIHYDTSPRVLNDWRNRITFVSDDDDHDSSGTHVRPSERHADQMEADYPNLNVDKIYLDAYPQIATSGGQKIPAVNDAIDQTMFKGVLAINYFGHGGPKGWAQERVLKIENILSWENQDRLPLFITATCTFAGYDDPSFKSAGEEVFLNPKGGAFALLSTTRAVYISGNETLALRLYEQIFEREPDGTYLTLGELFTRGKNNTGGLNGRKFTLIGDPSMRLALPEYNVTTTMINTHDVSDGMSDTLRAMQEVTIEGMITDQNGDLMNDFNGSVYPTIFDKKATVETLGHEPGKPPIPFELQKNILFKGKASVIDGKFQFTFVMPSDINYQFGVGKISYYAENGVIDASGNYQKIVIGGTDPTATSDDEGPLVEVFMNNENFRSGGITDENPILFVKLSDDNGINVAGTSIGHDLIAVLDDNSQEPFVLNDFYESELNNFQKGFVRFPLSNLAEGRHRIKVTAWDVANNFGEGFTEFVVANSETAALLNVLNYPNPFIDQTCISFEHNLAGEDLTASVQIYDMAGKLVKSIESPMIPSGYRECLPWDGTSESGQRLARGVYVYKVTLRSNADAGATFGEVSEYQKMVLLK